MNGTRVINATVLSHGAKKTGAVVALSGIFPVKYVIDCIKTGFNAKIASILVKRAVVIKKL